MRPEKTESFTFRKHATGEGAEGGSAKMQNCRRKLQDRFEQSENGSSGTSSGRSGVVSGLSLEETRRALRNGSERVSRALSSFRTSLGSFSQRFKISTKRRQILEEGPMTPNGETPQTFSRKILGRTPTKLYSPFGIESPYSSTTYDKENVDPIEMGIRGK